MDNKVEEFYCNLAVIFALLFLLFLFLAIWTEFAIQFILTATVCFLLAKAAIECRNEAKKAAIECRNEAKKEEADGK